MHGRDGSNEGKPSGNKAAPAYATLNATVKQSLHFYDSLRRNDQYERALPYLDSIIILEPFLLTDSSLKPYFVTATLYKAYALRGKEKYAEAENLLIKLLAIQPGQWKKEPQHADALTMLGNIYTRYGDYKKALSFLHAGKKIFEEEKDTIYFVNTVNNICIALQELNRFKESLNLLQEAVAWNSPSPKSSVITYTLMAKAALHLKENAAAHISLEKAKMGLCFFENDDDRQYYAALIDQVLADLLVVEGNVLSAAALYKSAATVNENLDSDYRKSRDCGKLYNQLGRVYLDLNKVDSALHFFHLALFSVADVEAADIFSLPSTKKLYAENTVLEALDAEAAAFELKYKQNPDIRFLQTALQCYSMSFEVERKLMQYFSYDESKLQMLDESRIRSQRAISLCYKLFQLTRNQAWAENAFNFAEKNKAFVLLESVKRNLVSDAALQSDTLYEKSQALQLQLAYLERKMAGSETDSAKAKLAEKKEQLENNLLLLKTTLARQNGTYKALIEDEDSLSTAMISNKLLDEHSALAEFFCGNAQQYVFFLTKDGPVRFYQLGQAVFRHTDSVLSCFHSPAAIANDPAGYQQLAYRLYEELGFNTMDRKIQSLIIIPDGQLSFLPFDALVTGPPFSSDLGQANWLINRLRTDYGYSASILLKQMNEPAPDYKQVKVFAPVFNGGPGKLEPLLYTKTEAEEISRKTGAKLFVENDASLANFRDFFDGPGVIHIATHAYADTASGSNNARIEMADSSLRLNELYAMHTNASLVVLSACETGLGNLSSSEGPLSLARGFSYAGARNVITSYWTVDDKSTAGFFTAFYNELHNQSSAIALHKAKLQFLANARGAFTSPYYWAGFVHYGPSRPAAPPPGRVLWLLLIIPALLAIKYFFRKNRPVE